MTDRSITSNLGSLREYAKTALSPSNAQFYNSCADEIERLRSENATLTAVCSLWGLNPDPKHETNATRAALLSGDSKLRNAKEFAEKHKLSPAEYHLTGLISEVERLHAIARRISEARERDHWDDLDEAIDDLLSGDSSTPETFGDGGGK